MGIPFIYEGEDSKETDPFLFKFTFFPSSKFVKTIGVINEGTFAFNFLGLKERRRSPCVLKLISMVISAAKEKGIDVEVCGEAATNKEALAWFLKEGLREISVPVSEVLKIKKIVRDLRI